MRRAQDPTARFMRLVTRVGRHWIWTGGTKHGKPAWFRVGSTRTSLRMNARHFAYQVVGKRGIVTPGWFPLPSCGKRLCVNPQCLELHTEDDGHRRRAWCKRNRHKMTPENVYKMGKTHRTCRACCLERQADYRRRFPERIAEWQKRTRQNRKNRKVGA